MRKLLFLLLITISSYGQALPNPQTLQNPTYGTVTIKNSATVTTTPTLTTTESNGLQKKIDPVNLPISTATVTALSGKANDTDVLHKTGNLNESANGEKIFTSRLGVGIFTSPLLNKFEVLVPSSSGDSSTSGIAVHDGQALRMGLNLGVNTESSYTWIQAMKGGVGAKPIFLNPSGGGVSIGNITDPGTGNLNIAGKATAGSPATVANDLMRKGEVDTALALKANLASPALTGTPTAPTATAGTNTTQVATTAFVLANSSATSGSYTPTITPGSNTSSVVFSNANYTKVGNIVNVAIYFTIAVTSAVTSNFTITLPVSRANTSFKFIGSGSCINCSLGSVNLLITSASNSAASVVFLPSATCLGDSWIAIKLQYSTLE